MKHIYVKVFSVLILLSSIYFISLPTQIRAQEQNSAVATSSALLQGGPHFFSGETVILDQNYQGDVMVAAQRVIIEGSIEGDALIAAGEVEMSGEVTQDMRVVGGSVVISGQIGGNLTAIAGRLSLTEESAVGNGSVLAGGTINTAGLLAGNTFMAGEKIQLQNEFGGEVRLWGNELLVLPDTSVAGNFQAELTKPADISELALFQTQPEIMIRTTPRIENSPSNLQNFRQTFHIIKEIVTLVMNLAMGSILVYFFPRLFQKLTNAITKGPVVTLGWGFLSLLLAPLVIIFMIITIVGLPLAFLMSLTILISILVAPLISGMAVGQKVSDLLKQKNGKSEPYAQLAVGLVLLTVLSNLPWIGPVISGVSLVLGLGSLFIALKTSLRSPRTESKKLTL